MLSRGLGETHANDEDVSERWSHLGFALDTLAPKIRTTDEGMRVLRTLVRYGRKTIYHCWVCSGNVNHTIS